MTATFKRGDKVRCVNFKELEKDNKIEAEYAKKHLSIGAEYTVYSFDDNYSPHISGEIEPCVVLREVLYTYAASNFELVKSK